MKISDKKIEQNFIMAAIANHELREAGNIKGSNAAHRKASLAMMKIRQRPDRGKSFLKDAICHPHANVRLGAATYLLPIDTPAALAALHAIENDDDCPWQVRALVEGILDLWKTGQLELV